MVFKDENNNWIGRGERTAQKILEFVFHSCYVDTQVPMSRLQGLYDPQRKDKLSDENLKRTIDLFVVSHDRRKKVNIAVRVQDTKGHKGDISGNNDSVQRAYLETWGIKVIDLHERECPNLFKERLDWKSVLEVLEAFKDEL